MTDEAQNDAQKREALRAKIEAGEARQAERSFGEQARSTADDALEFVKANPLKSVAAVALGALVIGAMTRPGRRAGKKAGKLAGIATDAAVAYAIGLFDAGKDAADTGKDRMADVSHKVRRNAREWQEYAAKEGSELSDYLMAAARRSGKRASRTVDDLRARLTN